MRISKARMVIADRGLYLHVNPHTGAEFESEHKVLIFSDYPGDPPMTVARAQTLAQGSSAKGSAPKPKPKPARTKPASPAKPAGAGTPKTPNAAKAPKAPTTAMRIRGAEEKVATRAWTPGAPAKKP